MSRNIVYECRVDIGVTHAYILRIRHIEDILQLRNRRVVCPRAEEYTQGILLVEGYICHCKVHKVVVALVDLVALLANNITCQLRTLILEICHDAVLTLRKAEARTYTMSPETTCVLLRHIRVCHHTAPIAVGVECVFIVHLILVSHTILQRELRRLADRLVVGEVCTYSVLLTWTVDILVEWRIEQRAICHILPYLALTKVVVILGLVIRRGIRNTIRLVGCGLLFALVVLVVETTIHRESSSRLTEFGTQLQELVEVEGALFAPTIRLCVCQRLMWCICAIHLLGISIFAYGVALGIRGWVVTLIGEIGTRHQRCVTRDFPVQTGIETSVEIHGVRLAKLIHISDRHWRLVPLLGTRVVVGVGVVEEE